MRRFKLLITIIAIAVSLATLMTQETLAYYSVLGEDVNVITSGQIKCKVIEKMGDVDFPKEGVYIKPGLTVSKKVSVQNVGKNPFWLRIKLINAIDGETLPPDIMELDINTTDWIDGGDGFYYYKQSVEPGIETEKLFTQVKIAGDTDSKYLGKTVKLTVCAYAVQSQNSSAASPLDVNGWPAEIGGIS